MNTRVHITVDTEFSIAGAFDDPRACAPVGPPAVYCEVDGRSQGLGYLLETLAHYGLRATFFVEALNTCHFGDGPMGAIARRLHEEGHDVQLHLHPCWTYFEREDWAARLAADPPNDDITRRSPGEIVRLIELGKAAFARWGVRPPTVLRTGGLKVSRPVYEAMHACGMTLASNVGLAIFRPAETDLHLYAGRHEVAGVTEIPVTTYEDLGIPGRPHYKTLTVTGSSWPEMRALLQDARRKGVSDVVVLTHPFEYVKHRDITYERLYLNRVTRRRLDRLCRFLSSEPGFEAVCMGDAALDEAARRDNTLLSVPPLYAAGRMIVNRLNHAVMWP